MSARDESTNNEDEFNDVNDEVIDDDDVDDDDDDEDFVADDDDDEEDDNDDDGDNDGDDDGPLTGAALAWLQRLIGLQQLQNDEPQTNDSVTQEPVDTREAQARRLIHHEFGRDIRRRCGLNERLEPAPLHSILVNVRSTLSSCRSFVVF